LWEAAADEKTCVSTVSSAAVGIRPRDKGVEIHLADGTVRFGDAAARQGV